MISLSQIQTQKDKQYNKRRQSYIQQKLKHLRINFRSKKSQSKYQFTYRHLTEFGQFDDCKNKQWMKGLQKSGCILNEGVEVCESEKSELSQSTMQQSSRHAIKSDRQYKQQEQRLLNKIMNLMLVDTDECQYQQQHQLSIRNTYYQTYMQLCQYCNSYKSTPILKKILQSLTSTLLFEYNSSKQHLKQKQKSKQQSQPQSQSQSQSQSQQMTQQHFNSHQQQLKQLQSYSFQIVNDWPRAYWVYACFLLAAIQYGKDWYIEVQEWVRVGTVLVNGLDVFGDFGLELLINLYRNIPQMLAPSHHSHITHLNQTLQTLLNTLSKSPKQTPPSLQTQIPKQHSHQVHHTNLCQPCQPQTQQIYSSSIIYQIVQYMLHNLNIDILMNFINFGLLDTLENLNSCDEQYNLEGKHYCGVGDRLINICVERCQQVKEDYKKLYQVIREKYG